MPCASLSLHEIAVAKDQVTQASRIEIAKDAITESMRRLRLVISDLRQDSVTGLEKALANYIESTDAEADVRLRVSGDETWASPIVIDEAFLVIREAIRNALTHGLPQMVLIGIAVTPDELRAWVDDDGRGFDQRAEPPETCNGLTSMRERAALLGGQLTVTSQPALGTRVELVIPLTGYHNVRSG